MPTTDALRQCESWGTAWCDPRYASLGPMYSLDPSCNVNTAGPDNVTPLMMAAYKGHIHKVTALLAAGADCSVKDTRGWTARHHCAEGVGSVPVASAILAASKNAGMLKASKCKDGVLAWAKALARGHDDLVSVMR